jgi:hypothetical protein
MAKISVESKFNAKPRRKRPGVHSKNKSSGLKSSKLYKKQYKGQGRA